MRIKRIIAAASAVAALGAFEVGCAPGLRSTFDAQTAAATGAHGTLRPPGAQDAGHFEAACTSCALCADACPYGAIYMAGLPLCVRTEQPAIAPRQAACHLCADLPCVAACPTGALGGIDAPAAVRMGTAVIDETTCLSYAGMRCEVCYRACPLIDQAISIEYKPLEGDNIHAVFAPTVNTGACTGCGLCVERCVTDTPSITIQANR